MDTTKERPTQSLPARVLRPSTLHTRQSPAPHTPTQQKHVKYLSLCTRSLEKYVTGWPTDNYENHCLRAHAGVGSVC